MEARISSEFGRACEDLAWGLRALCTDEPSRRWVADLSLSRIRFACASEAAAVELRALLDAETAEHMLPVAGSVPS